MAIARTWQQNEGRIEDAFWGYAFAVEPPPTPQEPSSVLQCWSGEAAGGNLTLTAIFDSERRSSHDWLEQRAPLLCAEPQLQGEEPFAWLLRGPSPSCEAWAWVPTPGTLCFELSFQASLSVKETSERLVRLLSSFELLYPVPLGNPGVLERAEATGRSFWEAGLFLEVATILFNEHQPLLTARETYLAALLLDRLPPAELPQRLPKLFEQKPPAGQRDPWALLTALSPHEEGHQLNALQRWLAWEGLALCYAYLGQLPEAETIFSQSADFAVEKNKDDPAFLDAAASSLYALANLRFVRENPSGAAQTLERWLALQPTSPEREQLLYQQINHDPDFFDFLETEAARRLFAS